MQKLHLLTLPLSLLAPYLSNNKTNNHGGETMTRKPTDNLHDYINILYTMSDTVERQTIAAVDAYSPIKLPNR